MTATSARLLVATWALAAITAAALGYDAYVHADLAGNYDAIRTSTVSQGDLFRVESALAALAALLVIGRPRRYTAAFAAVVAGSGLAALIAYRYWDIGRLGPLPDMYEPVWFAEKTRTTIAQAVGSATALALLGITRPRAHR